MSQTYLKLNNDWLVLFQHLNEQIAEVGAEILTTMAQEYASDVVSDDADEFEFESAVHFFTAVFFIWRKDQKVTRIKLKHVNKLAESMMNTVTNLTNNPETRNKLNMMNFTHEQASKSL